MAKSRHYKKLQKRFSRKRGGSKRLKINDSGQYIVKERDHDDYRGELELLPSGQLGRYDDVYPIVHPPLASLSPHTQVIYSSYSTEELEEELRRIRELLGENN